MVYICIMQGEEMITISKAEYQQFLDQKSTLQEQQSEIEWLKHQLDELKRLIYGSKRERFISPILSPRALPPSKGSTTTG